MPSWDWISFNTDNEFRYADGGTPIIEVLYSVAVWFPSIYKRGGVGNKTLEQAEKKDDDGNESFDEKSMEEKEIIIHSELIIKALRAIVYATFPF